ncbi:solute carrier family 22 member 6-B-like isoform X1 [Biomphalaria pfeifferi]|uniref:Solute carrier family 22 member 6-B-like isoform X1 n=1 Tax=Biomphalaria pfeifferi TaxID=112525 RepID=A0AAD8BDT9_BIOPF|nr:solute carrier family 22 member 6-B-like isoform X1 [Biomphalaria pfeifferi]
MEKGSLMDEVFNTIGWWGRYQKTQFLMCMLPVLACASHVLSVIFIGRDVPHKCAHIDSLNISEDLLVGGNPYDVTVSPYVNVTVTYEACSVDVKNGSTIIFTSGCINGHNYSESRDMSIVSQWDLVCEGEALSDLSQTILSLGQLSGALICTSLADIYGRKPTYIVSHIILLCTAIALSFSPNYLVFIGLRFVLGFSQQGTGLVSNVLLVEMLPTKRRALPSQVGSYMWIMDESPRWLLANNNMAAVEAFVQKASAMNKTDPDKALDLLRRKHLSKCTDSHHSGELTINEEDCNQLAYNGHLSAGSDMKTSDENMRFTAFVKNRSVFLVTAVSCYMWFTDSLTYYGLIMTSTSLTDDFYLGYFFNVLVELPAALAFGFLINRIGRKKCTSVFHLIGGMSLLVSVVLNNASFADDIPGKETITFVISLIGKFGISVAFAVLNTGFGISSMAARIGGMVAPYSRTFERHVPWGPGAVFTFLCLLVPVVGRFLPETHGHELPQTIADMDQWIKASGRKSKNKEITDPAES